MFMKVTLRDPRKLEDGPCPSTAHIGASTPISGVTAFRGMVRCMRIEILSSLAMQMPPVLWYGTEPVLHLVFGDI